MKTAIAGHSSDVWGVDISPDRQLIASASFDNTVKLWHLDGTLVTTIVGHANGVLRVSFSPDSRQIASASADGTVKIWQTDGTSVNTLNSDIGWVWDVAWNPQGTLLASGTSRFCKNTFFQKWERLAPDRSNRERDVGASS